MLNVIPYPALVEFLSGTFMLNDLAAIDLAITRGENRLAVEQLQQGFSRRLGRTIALSSHELPRRTIRIEHSTLNLGNEGYELTIEDRGIVLRTGSEAGIFYGVQTLLQMLSQSTDALPAVRIVDRPRFPWRGLMLDVCRHLFSKQDILRHLDAMAAHKLNVFHWHLTDDQGWRIEIKTYPKLMDISAWRKRGDGRLVHWRNPEELKALPDSPGRYGGFFTEDDVREIVAYAAERYITVVPEIEMPGHASAALAAYPELSCTGGPHEVVPLMGIFKEVYCAGNDAAFTFLENVLSEVIPLFPGEFVHVGGDECLKDRWKQCPKCQARIKQEGLADEHELQSYFIRRFEKFLTDRGKRLIGWDEILEGGLAPNATVMSWRGTQGGLTAAQAGHDVVMTPQSHVYLDFRQADHGEPRAINSPTPTTLQHVYAYEPVPPELTPEQAKHVLGVQGNLWTEYMHDMQHVEYMAWPRACALAEIAWSPRESRHWPAFKDRVRTHQSNLKALGVNYRPLEKDESPAA